MSEHFIVAADNGHLRIYAERIPSGQRTAGIEQVESMDFPQGRHGYTDRDTDVAGRFASSRQKGAGPGAPTPRQGMSIDERLPMQREEARRRAREIAAEIDTFFRSRPNASWDFAAGPELNGTVLELISKEVRQRVQRSVAKDLVNERIEEIRAHFAAP